MRSRLKSPIVVAVLAVLAFVAAFALHASTADRVGLQTETSGRQSFTGANSTGFTVGHSPIMRGQNSQSPPPPSPGLEFAKTSWDAQQVHSSGHQVGRNPGQDIVHFCWTHVNNVPAGLASVNRFVNYNSFSVSSSSFNQGFGGCVVSRNVNAYAGSANLAVGADHTAQLFYSQRQDLGVPFHSWHSWLLFYGQCLQLDDELTPFNSAQMLTPRGAISQNFGGTDIVHVVSHGVDSIVDADTTRDLRLVYWRYNGTVWQGPVLVDSTPTLGHVVVADPNSQKAAIVLHTNREAGLNGVNNIAYYKSNTEGAGWISGAELGNVNKTVFTNYTDPAGPEAWRHIAAAYDNSGRLNIVWDERLQPGSRQAAIRHWNDQRATIRTVAFGNWPLPHLTGGDDLNLAKLSLGIGDGATFCQNGATTNRDNVYVLYTRFGGPTAVEQADYSAFGYYNGELYLQASTTSGNTWSPPVNLTNTKTPGCNPGPASQLTGLPPRPDSVCRSEHWASIGQEVHDIDIMFISDLDAGSITVNEGTWQLNPVHYLRIPGGRTNAQHVCPVTAPYFAAYFDGVGPDVGDIAYTPNPCLAPGGTTDEPLTIMNLGNAALEGAIVVTDFPGGPTLTVSGSSAYTIVAGDPDIVRTVTMAANGAPEAFYTGSISITHNDLSQASPLVVSIDLVVSDTCPGGACQCAPCHADPQCDGIVSDVVDVVQTVAVAFRGQPEVQDPDCPTERTDLNCDTVTDVIDVVVVVSVAFRGASPAAYCDPCA